MKRGMIVVTVSLILILSISLVSAGWFSDFWNRVTGRTITGSVIQENIETTAGTSWDSAWGFGGTRYKANGFSFTTGDMYPTRFCFRNIRKSSTAITFGDVTVQIRTTGGSYNTPTSTVLASATISQASILTYPLSSEVCVDFTSPPLLNQGTVYAVVASSLSSEDYAYQWSYKGKWDGSTSARPAKSDNSDTSWSAMASNLDYAFSLTGVSEITPSCTDECTPSGSTQCLGNIVQVCGNYDADTCLEWSSLTACAAPTPFCLDGSCVQCIINENCNDNNVCTTDVCTSGTCSNTQIANDCGTRVCGNSPSGCFNCGSCSAPTPRCNTNGQCVQCLTNSDCSVGYVCSSGTCQLSCTPTTEICDGLDNDCDSLIDEDFTNLGEACTVGLGECQATGTYMCSADGTTSVCNAVIGTPTTETCDGLDNDCDSLVDEGNVCQTQTCNGCDYQQVCAPFGFRTTIDSVSSYCDLSKQFVAQKAVDADCFNNWECSSNQCADGKCVGLVEEIRAQTSLLWRILCTILHPISDENYCVCLTGDETRTTPEYLACLAG